VHCQCGRKSLPGDRRCGLSSSCQRRTEPWTSATCTKMAKRWCVWFRRYRRGQTDTQKRRQTDILITIFHNRSGGRSKAPFTRYNLLSNRLPIDNRLNVCIHDTTGCQTGLTTGCIVYIQTFNRLYRVNRV